MNPKKIITVFLFTLFTATVIPAFAGEPIKGLATEKMQAEQVVNRLIEIRNMDKSNLTTSEKRELRKEVKHLKKEAPKRRSGLYISVGTIIVVGLLLLLLL